MKQVPEQYLTPVINFLSTKLKNKYSDAVIAGGLIRDLVLGHDPKDTDVLIKTDLTVDEILATISLDESYDVINGYGDGHFTDNFKLLIRDVENTIDYLFIHDDLAINRVIHSFDCSLNKGYALPHLGIIYPPNLGEFTYDMASGNIQRFTKFSVMFINYHN